MPVKDMPLSEEEDEDATSETSVPKSGLASIATDRIAVSAKEAEEG